MEINFIIIFLIESVWASEKFLYEGFKIYDVTPNTKSQSEILYKFAESTPDIDVFVLSALPNQTARLMVAPRLQGEFEDFLGTRHISYEIVLSDVSDKMEENAIELRTFNSNNKIQFDRFYRFSDIIAYMDDLAKQYPSFVRLKQIGLSFEQRPLKALLITNGNFSRNKNLIFIDAGIHSREWIAPAAALYVIHQLIEKIEINRILLDKFTWMVLPVLNPDGYEYSHTYNRLWRKTRKRNVFCYGTDANRNFGFHWGERGSSTSSCDENYQGSRPFSEPETQALRDTLHRIYPQCKFYLTLHSYGNYILYPWGYTKKLPENWHNIDDVAKAGARAIKSATGRTFITGSSTNVLYAAAGGSDDYALGIVGIPIAITMELQKGGPTGFNPHPRQILGMVSETWIGIKAMANRVSMLFS